MDKTQRILEEVNRTLFELVKAENLASRDPILEEMILDALGLDQAGSAVTGGKRVRPLICCLVCGAVSGDHASALLISAALEMFHNFTLVHDDIEDQGEMRRGQPSLWKKWGVSLSLNAGDYLSALSYKTIHQAAAIGGIPLLTAFDAIVTRLIFGQHRDISFESQDEVSEAAYLEMIDGKTVALIQGSFELGAIAGKASADQAAQLRLIGEQIGLAFQMQDDYLGIWGDAQKIGKSVSTDITTKKKTLPIQYALNKDADLLAEWKAYDGNPDKVAYFSERLAAAGADEYTRACWQRAMDDAAARLGKLPLDNEYQAALAALIDQLMVRNK